MNYDLQAIRQLRETLLNLTADLSLEQLNHVPPGFNNNIIWNMAHVIASQQGICYLRSGLPMRIDTTLHAQYKPGSKPEGNVDAEFVANIRGLLLSTIDVLATDLEAGIFQTYDQVVTRYGVPITNINEGINFLKFHEGFHMGYVSALKRAIIK